MKKVLLSLAVLAASGLYVVAEHQYGNDAGPPLGPAGIDAATPAEGAPSSLPPLDGGSPLGSIAPPARGNTAGMVDVAEITPLGMPGQPAIASDAAPPQLVAQAAGQYRDGSYKGSSVDAYWGRVQVQAVIQGGKLASVKMLQYPHDRRRSAYISQQALPELEQEAVSNQSAQVDILSGATMTSEAFQRSLANALGQAGGGQAGNNA